MTQSGISATLPGDPDPLEAIAPLSTDAGEKELRSSSKQVNETVQAIRQAFELRNEGGLSDSEFQALKRSLLKQNGIEVPTNTAPTITSGEPAITEHDVRKTQVSLYASELHRLIVQEIENVYRHATSDIREYMLATMNKLLELGDLYPQDKPYIENLINVVCNKPQTLELGLQVIATLDTEVSNNVTSSDVAKTLVGIAHGSAKHAVDILQSQRAKEPNVAEQTWWDAVQDDVVGGLTGAVSSSSIAAVQGFSLAALGFAGALSVPIIWMPAAGALLGAGITSGWKYARARFDQPGSKR